MDFTESIAVIGPEEAGKTYLFRQIGEPIPKQWSHDVPEPLRYRIHPNNCPELERTVFSVYENLSQMRLDLPEWKGMIVLNLEQLNAFSKPDALTQYFGFFEFFRKLVWLGVDQFVLAITHMDLLRLDASPWFYRTSKQVAKDLEALFDTNIKGPVPLTLDESGLFDNIVKAKPKDILPWNEGPTLMNALREMALCHKAVSKNGLWTSGKIGEQEEDRKTQWRVLHQARGEMREKQIVRVYPEDFEAKIVFNCKNIELEYDAERLGIMTNSEEASVLVSVDSDAKEHTLINVHAVLKSGISPFDLQKANHGFTFTFFGPQNKEGEIDKSTPCGIATLSPEISDQRNLMFLEPEEASQALGQEAYLRISCRGSGAVTSLYNKDVDAGRLLIWDVRDPSRRTLIGVGRITDFPNILIQDFTEKLMLFDQYRAIENPASKLLIFILEKIYHDSKRFAQTSAHQLDPKFIKKRRTRMLEDFENILKETLTIQGKIRNKRLPSELGNLHAHLSHARDKLSGQYEDLFLLISEEKSENVVQHRLESLKEEFTRNKEYVRTQTFRPFLNCAKDAESRLTKEMRSKVKIHNRMPKDWSFYPKRPSALETVSEALCQLLDNSCSYACGEGKIRVDIFIDPPSFKSPDYVRIQYQDNGFVDESVLRRIKESESGIKILEKKLSDEKVEFQYPVHLGCGTTFVIKIPTWRHRLENLENAATDLVDILSVIDYKLLKMGQKNSNFLIRLKSILENEDRLTLQQNLTSLFLDAKGSSMPRDPWFQSEHSYFSIPTDSASFIELGEIRRTVRHLSNHPVFHAVYEAVSFAKLAFPKFSIHLPDSCKSLSLHRVESASFYHFLVDTFSWGLIDLIIPYLAQDSRNKLEFSFQISPPGQDEYITVFLTEMSEKLSGILLPLKSRLVRLGVSMAFPEEMKNSLVFHIPVQTLKV